MYGCQIWGQQNTQMNMISKLQNRALKIINFENFRANTNPLYKSNKILKIEDLVKHQNVLHVHDYLNNNLPECFQDYFFKLNYIYFNTQTRNSNLGCLFTPSKKSTTYGLQSITQQCIYNWNKISKLLNTDLLTLSRSTLKFRLKQFFINQY